MCEQYHNCWVLPQVYQLRAAVGGTRMVPARWTETQEEAGAGHPGDGGGVQRKVEGDQRTAHQTSGWGQSQEEAEGKIVDNSNAKNWPLQMLQQTEHLKIGIC